MGQFSKILAIQLLFLIQSCILYKISKDSKLRKRDYQVPTLKIIKNKISHLQEAILKIYLMKHKAKNLILIYLIIIQELKLMRKFLNRVNKNKKFKLLILIVKKQTKKYSSHNNKLFLYKTIMTISMEVVIRKIKYQIHNQKIQMLFQIHLRNSSLNLRQINKS